MKWLRIASAVTAMGAAVMVVEILDRVIHYRGWASHAAANFSASFTAGYLVARYWPHRRP